MLEDEVMVGNALPFDELMQACDDEVAVRANATVRQRKDGLTAYRYQTIDRKAINLGTDSMLQFERY